MSGLDSRTRSVGDENNASCTDRVCGGIDLCSAASLSSIIYHLSSLSSHAHLCNRRRMQSALSWVCTAMPMSMNEDGRRKYSLQSPRAKTAFVRTSVPMSTAAARRAQREGETWAIISAEEAWVGGKTANSVWWRTVFPWQCDGRETGDPCMCILTYDRTVLATPRLPFQTLTLLPSCNAVSALQFSSTGPEDAEQHSKVRPEERKCAQVRIKPPEEVQRLICG